MVSQSEVEPMMMPTSGFAVELEFSAVEVMVPNSSLAECVRKETPALEPAYAQNEALILRRFLSRRDFSALEPCVAELADKVERAGDEDGVARAGVGQGLLECSFGVGDDGKVHRVVASHFSKLRGADGAWVVGLGEDDFGGEGEEQAGGFVDSFVSHGAVDEDDAAVGESFFEEAGELASGAGIVSAVKVKVRVGMQFLEAAGPTGFGNAALDVFVGDTEVFRLEQARGGDRVERVLKLEAAGQRRSDGELGVRSSFRDLRMNAASFHNFLVDAKGFRCFNQLTMKFSGAPAQNFTGLGELRGADDRNAVLNDSRFFSGDFTQGVAEEVLVVEIDASNDAGDRGDAVGGV